MSNPSYSITRFINFGDSGACYDAVPVESENIIQPGTYVLKRHYLTEMRNILRCRRERDILVRLSEEKEQSPFIVQIVHALVISDLAPGLMLTKASDYNLCHLLMRTGTIREESKIRFYLCELVCALDYLHSRQVVHKDLTVENVLLADSGHIVLCDFDRAFDFAARDPLGRTVDYSYSAFYVAPEIALMAPFTCSADIFNLGLVALTFLFWDKCPLFNYRLCGNVASFDVLTFLRLEVGEEKADCMSGGLREFIASCCHSDQSARATVGQLKGLPFFGGVNWEEVESLGLVPPYMPAQLDTMPADDQFTYPTTNRTYLQFARTKERPRLWKGFPKVARIDKETGDVYFECLGTQTWQLEYGEVYREVPTEIFKGYHFINPRFMVPN